MATNILVTGSARTGTTWIGETIAHSPEVRYVYEPFNLHLDRSHALRPSHQYLYVHPENDLLYRKRVEQIYRPTHWKDRMAQLMGYRKRTLQKDPGALFSSKWLASEFDAQVIMMIRHPAAVVSSRLRMQWRFDFNHLLDQTELIRDYLAPFEEEMKQRASEPDLLEEAILLWKVHYFFIDLCRQKHPEWLFVRHEDVCSDPPRQFAKIFEFLNLPLAKKIVAAIQKSTSERNPAEASGRTQHCLRRDSMQVPTVWKAKLSEEQIAHIRNRVSEVSEKFYRSDEW